jgi:hypothetical protein
MLSAESQQMIRDKFGPSKGRLTNLLDVLNFVLSSNPSSQEQ